MSSAVDNQTDPRRSERVLRHPLAVRITHWMVALSGIVLLFTGFGELPMYKRYNVIKIPGLAWAGDFELNLVIHYLAAFFFSAAVVFHIVYHLRRRETEALPKKGDVKESVAIIGAMIRGKKEPPHGKFLAEQRLAYAVMGGAALLLMVTGLIKVYKNMGAITLDPTMLQVVTLIHTLVGMLFMLLLIAHLAAFLIKANRPLLPSMFTGTVSRDYAEERHPLWQAEDASAPQKVTTREVLRFVPGVMVLASVGLAIWVSPWWLALAAFVGINLLQSAFTRWCLLESLLEKAGLPPCQPAVITREIQK